MSFISATLIGQNCSIVKGSKNKKTGKFTKEAVIESEHHMSLFVQKEYNSHDSLPYFLFLNVNTSRFLLDSILDSEGKFTITLTNYDEIIIPGVTSKNNPLGFGASIGFSAHVSEENMKKMAEYGIVNFNARELLATQFDVRRQNRFKKIMVCLINEL